jgi:chromosome segregation ATPase
MAKQAALLGSGILATALCVVAAGQARPAPAPGAAPQDELLVELRALRADLNQAIGASIRSQLLVARLQLQEQRVGSVARQLAEVQERASGVESGLLRRIAQLKSIEQPATGLPAEQVQEMERVIPQMRSELELERRRLADLRTQEASLSGQLSEAQSRWSEFNDRLDELERMLPARPR